MPSPALSFEFYPPKTLDGSFRLWETVETLAPYDPEFVSVTYGAGGTTRKLTHEAVSAISQNFGVNVAAHLTCVDATRSQTLDIAENYASAGVREIVALRGDPPRGSGAFQPHPHGFSDACELVSALRETGDFHIRVGAYPDRHPEAADEAADVTWLKRNVEAGAGSAITQFFFEAETFFRFRDACEKAGIDVPILPGILPIENWTGTLRFAARCGANVPTWLPGMFETAIRDNRADLLATAIATELCTDLIEGGVEHLHFYTLNRASLTREVCTALGYTSRSDLRQVA